MEYNILIKKGLGEILFDMPVEDVVAIMGEADDVESIDNAIDEVTTVLHYDDGQLTLFFEGTEPKLQCIDISSDKAKLFGENIFDLDEEQIVRQMVNNGYFEQDADTEDWGERRITFGEGNIDFYFDDGELIAIAYGK